MLPAVPGPHHPDARELAGVSATVTAELPASAPQPRTTWTVGMRDGLVVFWFSDGVSFSEVAMPMSEALDVAALIRAFAARKV